MGASGWEGAGVRGSVTSITMTIAMAAATVTATLAVTPAGDPVTVPFSQVALIIEGSSTNQGGDGIADFYGGRFKDGDTPVVVNFLTGPLGIWQALQASPGHNTVLSSGWGAANASLLLSALQATGQPVPADSTWVLDNNVANPNGGFGTRYPVFAAIGVNPLPTALPDGSPVVISTATEYDLNSNAPKYILNPVADLNSLATYLDKRLGQSALTLPVNDDGTPGCGSASACHPNDDRTYTVTVDGKEVDAQVTKVGGVTYVGYRTDHLPLLSPLRNYGGDVGNRLADAAEPALRAVVNYGYPDNDPLGNPGSYQPAGLVPSASETRTFLKNFRTGVNQGAATLTAGSSATRSTVRGGPAVTPTTITTPKLPSARAVARQVATTLGVKHGEPSAQHAEPSVRHRPSRAEKD